MSRREAVEALTGSLQEIQTAQTNDGKNAISLAVVRPSMETIQERIDRQFGEYLKRGDVDRIIDEYNFLECIVSDNDPPTRLDIMRKLSSDVDDAYKRCAREKEERRQNDPNRLVEAFEVPIDEWLEAEFMTASERGLQRLIDNPNLQRRVDEVQQKAEARVAEAIDELHYAKPHYERAIRLDRHHHAETAGLAKTALERIATRADVGVAEMSVQLWDARRYAEMSPAEIVARHNLATQWAQTPPQTAAHLWEHLPEVQDAKHNIEKAEQQLERVAELWRPIYREMGLPETSYRNDPYNAEARDAALAFDHARAALKKVHDNPVFRVAARDLADDHAACIRQAKEELPIIQPYYEQAVRDMEIGREQKADHDRDAVAHPTHERAMERS